jgi:hypothetical protein
MVFHEASDMAAPMISRILSMRKDRIVIELFSRQGKTIRGGQETITESPLQEIGDNQDILRSISRLGESDQRGSSTGTHSEKRD